MQGAGGVEAVGMGGNAAHGVKADRAARHGLVGDAPEIGPRAVQRDRLVEGDAGDLGGQSLDPGSGDAGSVRHGVGRIVGRQVARGHVLEHGLVAVMRRPQIGAHTLGVEGRGLPRGPVDHQQLVVLVAQQQTILAHQAGRVGPLREVVQIDAPGRQQFVDDRQDQQPVGARRDPVPVVGHRVIAGADRVHPNHPRPPLLQLADPHLDRVAVMVLGHAEQDEQPGAVPIRLAKLPERAADGVDAARRHVHRTEAAMGCVVRRTEALRPVAGQALGLVAPGEEGELFRGLVAQRSHPGHRQRQRLVPAYLLERARPARAHPF